MGPKSVAATVPSKDLSWLGRVCLKIENICAEVDRNPSILFQETSKYVESQVKEVGVNVKKLCNELMHDLLPPPIVASEVAEKMPECAVHCKCNCMDYEKPKQKNVIMSTEITSTEASSTDVQAKASEERKKSHEESALEKQNISTRVNMKFNMGNKESAYEKVEIPKIEQKKHKCTGAESMQFAEYDEARNDVKEASKHICGHEEAGCEVKESASPVSKDAAGSLEGQPQESGEHQENGAMEVEALTRKEEDDARVREEITSITVRQSGCIEAAVSVSVSTECRREELTRDGREFTGGTTEVVAEENGMVIKTRGLDVKGQQQTAEIPFETPADRRSSMTSKGSYALDANIQELLDSNTEEMSNVVVPSFGMMDAMCPRLSGGSLFSPGVNDAVGIEDAQKVGVDLRFMYSYVFSENSRSFKEDSMTLSEYHLEEEAEQTARWLVAEDLRNMIDSGVFSAENSQQGENCSKELDFEWELV